jgi:hypothetical protein
MDQAISFSSSAGTIRIFKPGSFTSVDGSRHSFSRDDLVQAAAAYDPDGDPAPLVIGHPAIDHPAYGWATGLRLEGDELIADVDRVESAFAETVNAGRYRKVSASFYPPAHHGNPKPGSWYLKHIGFLGAAAPALKGLGTVSLAEGDGANPLEGLVSFALHDTPKNEPSQEKSPVTTKTEDKTVDFAERQRELDERETAIKAREEAAIKAARDARHTEHVSFAEGMVSKGTLAPAGKSLLVGVLDQLGEKVEPVSFGEAEADKMPPAAALKKLLGGAVPLVSFAELAPKPGEKAKTAVANFAAPAGYQVDPTQADLYARAKSIQAEKPDIAWMDAVRQAQG